MDGGVEGGCIEGSLVGEVMCLEIAPDKLDVAYVPARIWAATRR